MSTDPIERPKLTQDVLQGLVTQAYMEYGYNVIRWKDGSIGIEGASERQTLITTRISELILQAVGEVEPSKELIHLARKGKLLCGIEISDSVSYVKEVAWITGRVSCPICRSKAKYPPGRRI